LSELLAQMDAQQLGQLMAQAQGVDRFTRSDHLFESRPQGLRGMTEPLMRMRERMPASPVRR
jgi:hypothetical protein